MIKTRIFQFVGHIHSMPLCIEMISFINHENESILRWFYSFVNPGILAFVLGAWSGCIQAGWGSDLWLSAVVLWNSASHVSTMLRSNLDLSDIRPWYSTLWSRGSATAEAPRRLRSRGLHIDLADRLEMGSPYIHLYSPCLALSRGGSLSCSSSPLSESALICSSFSPRRFICFVLSGAHYGHSRFIYECFPSDRVYLSGCLTAFNFE